MKVVWTNAAIEHLSGIYGYIAQDSPEYGLRMVDRITNRSKQIESFPQSGGQVLEYRNPQIRELIEGSYRLIYRCRDSHVEILAVIHGSRELPPSVEQL